MQRILSQRRADTVVLNILQLNRQRAASDIRSQLLCLIRAAHTCNYGFTIADYGIDAREADNRLIQTNRDILSFVLFSRVRKLLGSVAG